VCDGSESESQEIIKQLVDAHVLKPLDSKLRPNSYVALTDPADVARSEEATFICSEKKQDAGPTNNWVEPMKMRKRLQSLFEGSMKGKFLCESSRCAFEADIRSNATMQLTRPYDVCRSI
jgi:phosphoenolpyruvate carboxykinase (GTP)